MNERERQIAPAARRGPIVGEYGPCDYCSGVGCNECCSPRDLGALRYYAKHGQPLIDEWPVRERKTF